MRLYISIAWRNIWRNKKRSLITISSILFAAFFVLFMRTMQLGSYAHIIDSSVRMFSGHIRISKMGYEDKKSVDRSIEYNGKIEKMLNKKYITSFNPKLESFLLISSGTKTKVCDLKGIDYIKENAFSNLGKRLVTGEFLSGKDNEIMICKGLAKYLNVKLNDEIVFYGQGYRGITAAYKGNITGIIDLTIPRMDNSYIYMNLKDVQSILGMEGRITTISILIDNNDKLKKYSDDLKKSFNSDYEIFTWKTLLKELLQQIKLDNISGIIVLWVLYMIVAFGILGTVIMMTMERVKEFSILIAIGMKRSRLVITMFLELLFMSILGLFSGIFVSYPVIYYFYLNPIKLTGKVADAMLEMGYDPIIPFSMDPSIFLVQILCIFIVVLIISIYPLVMIQRLKVAESIRS